VTAVLGLSCFYHDAAAALLVDGKVVAAVQEERFTRKKHDPNFPANAVKYCLDHAGLSSSDLVAVAYYDKPLLKLDRLFETYLAISPKGFLNFRTGMPSWVSEKLFVRRTFRKELPGVSDSRYIFTDHHESHAASAFFPSPFEESAILTLDGVGEWDCATHGYGSDNHFDIHAGISFPHSLGLLYSAFTSYCGFKVNSGEYKLMGLAPYGTPKYATAIRDHLINIKPDGSFALNLKFFNFCEGLRMTSEEFHQMFGGPPRRSESKIEQRHMDLAASIQRVTEDVVLSIARHLRSTYRCENLCLAGGVALNCVANGMLLRQRLFKNIWVQPAAGDAGGALGAALFAWHQLMGRGRVTSKLDSQSGSLLGPEYSDTEIEDLLGRLRLPHTNAEDDKALFVETAKCLEQEMVVGWFQGRMEFGPRSLGSRSILGDPRSSRLQSTMNLRIKHRESFRPFAPAVLDEYKSDWFDIDAQDTSPYMLFTAPVLEKHRTRLGNVELEVMAVDPDLSRRVNIARSSIPAVTHVDYSARMQTVDDRSNKRFRGLLRAFHQRTACPILINTSFNIRGEPIVCTPEDALKCFAATGMDVLVLGRSILRADAKPVLLKHFDLSNHISNFELD
jgi:carbamoyltransferase